MNKSILFYLILMPILLATISFFMLKGTFSIIIVIICGILTSIGLKLLIYN